MFRNLAIFVHGLPSSRCMDLVPGDRERRICKNLGHQDTDLFRWLYIFISECSVGLGYLPEITLLATFPIVLRCRRWRYARSSHFVPHLQQSPANPPSSFRRCPTPRSCTCEPQYAPTLCSSKLSFSFRRHVLPTTSDRFPVLSVHVH